MNNDNIRPPIKCHGGKWYLRKWIVDNFPENYKKFTYIEPYCGGASVLLAKQPSAEETINDLDPGIAAIMRTIRNDHNTFMGILTETTYCEKTFLQALENKQFDNEFDLAVNEFIVRRMSRGGLMKSFAWSERKRGGLPGDENAWKTIIDLLPIIAKRLAKVYIMNKNATEILDIYNDPDTLAYIDPPYLHETRTATEAYKFEMTEDAHQELCDRLLAFKGKVILSGYPSKMYSLMYNDWRRIDKSIKNHASQAKTKRTMTECLWMNY